MNAIGVILAGGRAKRLGGIDKGDMLVGGRTAFERVRDCLVPMLSRVAVSVARDYPDERYHGLQVIRDPEEAREGGAAIVVLGCLNWAGAEKGVTHIITTPVDTPFLPKDFVRVLTEAGRSDDGLKPVTVCSGGRVHGLHALWPVSILPTLQALIVEEGKRKIEWLHEELGSIHCDFPDTVGTAFLNINTPDDLRQAQTLLRDSI